MGYGPLAHFKAHHYFGLGLTLYMTLCHPYLAYAKFQINKTLTNIFQFTVIIVANYEDMFPHDLAQLTCHSQQLSTTLSSVYVLWLLLCLMSHQGQAEMGPWFKDSSDRPAKLRIKPAAIPGLQGERFIYTTAAPLCTLVGYIADNMNPDQTI